MAPGIGPVPSSHAATLLYASFALFLTRAEYTSEFFSAPSASNSISITKETLSSPNPSEVRSVESFSGSMGKVPPAVYTEVVFMRACSSIADPFFTVSATSAIATRTFVPSATDSATLSWSRSRESSLSIEHQSRPVRSRIEVEVLLAGS